MADGFFKLEQGKEPKTINNHWATAHHLCCALWVRNKSQALTTLKKRGFTRACSLEAGILWWDTLESWRPAVHGVAKSRVQLHNWTTMTSESTTTPWHTIHHNPKTGFFKALQWCWCLIKFQNYCFKIKKATQRRFIYCYGFQPWLPLRITRRLF